MTHSIYRFWVVSRACSRLFFLGQRASCSRPKLGFAGPLTQRGERGRVFCNFMRNSTMRAPPAAAPYALGGHKGDQLRGWQLGGGHALLQPRGNNIHNINNSKVPLLLHGCVSCDVYDMMCNIHMIIHMYMIICVSCWSYDHLAIFFCFFVFSIFGL